MIKMECRGIDFMKTLKGIGGFYYVKTAFIWYRLIEKENLQFHAG